MSLVQRKLETIFTMRIEEELSKEEYKVKKENLNREKTYIKQQINQAYTRFDTWLLKAEALLSFSETAKKRFDQGNIDEKKQIIQALGLYLILTDRTLQIKRKTPFMYLHEAKILPKAENNRLEPAILCVNTPKKTLDLELSEQ